MKIRFSSQSNIGSWLIRYRLNCRWSHVEFVLDNSNTIGSRFIGGVKERGPIEYLEYEDFAIPDIELKDIGSWYDYLALFGSLLGVHLQIDDWFQCSEYVAKQLIESGLLEMKSHHLAEPDELYEEIKQMLEGI